MSDPRNKGKGHEHNNYASQPTMGIHDSTHSDSSKQNGVRSSNVMARTIRIDQMRITQN